MSLVTANDLGVVAADFVLPLSRAWQVDMTVATNDPTKLNGAVVLQINQGNPGALTMNGTAKIEDVFLDTVRARVVAGAGGLAKSASPKFYRQTTVKIVLNDLLATAGESLSSTADAGVLGMQLAYWTVSKMAVGDAIGLLLGRVLASWRMLADGTLWCGSESWPDSGLAFTLEQEDKAHGQVIVSMEAPVLLPGVSLGGRKVSYVETHVDEKSVLSTAWLVTAASSDRLRDPMVAMARSSTTQVDYLGLYRAKVVAQSADLASVDVIPDDARLSSAGAQAVPLRIGLPGVKVQFSAGAYVLLGWINGDQAAPYAALWEGGETVQSIQLGGNDAVVTKADIAAIKTAISGAAVIAQDGGAALQKNILAAWPTSVGSTVVGAGR